MPRAASNQTPSDPNNTATSQAKSDAVRKAAGEKSKPAEAGGASVAAVATGAAEPKSAAKKTAKPTPKASSEAQPLPSGPADNVADADEAHVIDEPSAMNRAERRAKARGKQAPQPMGRGKIGPKGAGPAQGPRLWANRRAG